MCLVSIIIPTYNRANVISETIESVLKQTFQNFEIIIVDDGSIDNTKDIIKNFNDKRINYILIEHTGLPSKSRNQGILNAKGDYIAFLDSDDIWLPNKLEIQLKILEKNTELLAVSTNIKTFPIKMRLKKVRRNKIISFKEILKGNIIATSSILLKKEVINSIGLFDENPYLKAVEDLDYWLRILNYKNNSILVLKDKLVLYRISEDSTSNIKKADSFLNSISKFKIILEKYPNLDDKFVQKLLKKKIEFGMFIKFKTLLDNNNISLVEYITNKNLRFKFKLIGFISYFKRKLLRKIINE